MCESVLTNLFEFLASQLQFPQTEYCIETADGITSNGDTTHSLQLGMKNLRLPSTVDIILNGMDGQTDIGYRSVSGMRDGQHSWQGGREMGFPLCRFSALN